LGHLKISKKLQNIYHFSSPYYGTSFGNYYILIWKNSFFSLHPTRRVNGSLQIHSVSFTDAGLLRLGCRTHDFLQFLIVFDVTRCQSNVTESHVEIGAKIRTTCEFRYSTGNNLLTNHWTAPIQWISSGQFESCGDEMATQEASDPSMFLYRACVIQTAVPPEVPPVSCALSYRDFRKVFKDSNASRETDFPTIWTSTPKVVRHAITRVLVEQATVLIPAGNQELIQTYECVADGFPKPSFRWWNVERNTYVDGSALNVTVYRGHRLMAFTSVERYVCVANNSFNEQKSSEISVTVPSDLPFYVYIILGVVLLVILVSITANIVIGCRSTAKRRRSLAISGGQQKAVTNCAQTVAGESDLRYSGIDWCGKVHPGGISMNRRIGAGGDGEQRLSSVSVDHYTGLDGTFVCGQNEPLPSRGMLAEARAGNGSINRLYDTIASPVY
jgi:hypothetical protein